MMTKLDRRDFLIALAAMTLVVLSSNILVQYPFQHLGLDNYLTWGAFSYPFSFLVTDLASRRFGPQGARRVVYVGFALAVALSVILASPRIAIASGAAFLTSQLLDIQIFFRLRGHAWWMPPFVSSVISSALDTAIFFSFAFYCGVVPGLGLTISDALGHVGIADQCIALPWTNLAVADYLVKLALAAIAIAPYGAVLQLMRYDAKRHHHRTA
ncbi:queuosine precursor transporter [Microvirga lotononidis]|uniref:Probable queuosine precursor transporter n=1 Tax=Microvirga lotononidis TaxID=864069 RepID=I4YMG6_9HYPH|nr:queuosine precursor transporter [Microvirga lotononidis]EIM25158.1 putative integral membrane protein [Microvirga lotononidis]WQO29354.1 queuosine precursor transporter [Microvirga lotononidis]